MSGVLLQLYLIFAKAAFLTFGGGYAMIPLFQDEIVVKHAFMDATEFANLVALAQVTPGPIGLNAATYVGMSQAGLAGAVFATAGLMTPAFIVTLAVAVFMQRMVKQDWLATILKEIRPCVLGVILAAVVFFANTSLFTASVADFFRGDEFGICWQGVAIFAVVLFVQWKWRPHILLVLGGAALLGYLSFLFAVHQ